VIDGSEITFTHTNPAVDFTGEPLLPFVGTIDTAIFEETTIITTEVTNCYIAMGPTMGMVVDFGAMNLQKIPLFNYQAVSASEDEMLAGTVIELKVYAEDTFAVFANDEVKGRGTYVIADGAVTFTYTDPLVDFAGVAIPEIIGTIDTEEFEAATVLTTEATGVYLPMGPTYGSMVEYGPLELAQVVEVVEE